ncbi:TPA: IS3 family transposase [Clostridium botulinum]|uniref:Transposase n=14 Tax=Clostridium botulinum TaxID=1491 RepID=A0A3F2ZUH9_CLOB6|nr:IS3 family transposase [Clostridium botulinum]AJD26477.1 integrase core domain protein [Clostridium botulinum CDC_297]ACQ51941.1 transposase [Clostridium botulinum Ba4 str. 657]ACQ52108.1 transposase [Clostridium botulinum Ba4 str. 657]ACQ52666.1 transposase [Clostridium botulinum Ba4 str. 657]ACQ54071.1 transposase [Clostridium botulinum Ba4 str. 657]
MISNKYKYLIIKSLSSKFSIKLLCEISNISRSAYYKWTNTSKQCKDQEIMDKILVIYNDNRKVYGYRRIKISLKRTFGINVNHKKVLRLMQKLKIQSIIKMKKFKYKNPIANEYAKIENNVLNRNFEAKTLNQKWVTDITYLRYGNGCRAYLSAMMDLNNNEIIGYKLSTSLEIEFVIDTVKTAISKCSREKLKDLIIHSDQGCHYMSRSYKNLLKRYKITQSMSRKGNCYDNACIESFFSKLKTELIYQNKYYSKKDLFESIHKYIYWYNNERFQSKLKNHTPVEYRSVV